MPEMQNRCSREVATGQIQSDRLSARDMSMLPTELQSKEYYVPVKIVMINIHARSLGKDTQEIVQA